MELWTYQSLESAAELEQSGKLLIDWHHYSPNDFFPMTYRWMVKAMQNRGVDCGSFAPVWSWHSCGAYEAGPTLNTAMNLLSLNQVEAGIKLITFECPDELVVLNNYSPWNDIIDLFIDYRDKAVIEKALERRLFEIRPEKLEQEDAIQACLPYLLKEWVIDSEMLDLESFK